MSLGRVLAGLEESLGIVWSLGEGWLAASRRGVFGPDPGRALVLRDVRTRGFYVPLDRNRVELTLEDDGTIHGPNPYERVVSPTSDRIHARLRRRRGSRR